MNELIEREAICHELKTHPPYFAKVVSGEKAFELRVNDRDFRVGDTLRLLEWEPNAARFTGNKIDCQVTYIAQGVFGLPPDLCVMSVAATTANNGGLREALERVISAFTVEGRCPPYHRQQMALLKKNWNPLHTALMQKNRSSPKQNTSSITRKTLTIQSITTET